MSLLTVMEMGLERGSLYKYRFIEKLRSINKEVKKKHLEATPPAFCLIFSNYHVLSLD